ncbi:hypothetical protein phiK7A1_137 [Pseudomonas phage phiK7A1]|uniref:Uncharacterized protein n=1 Tax=Pseudomonas phage phiK7A1 TaxID=2759194 RepID=A0A7H0XFY5_9CAUD|nr:hypothetical protein phiK7A1_137 [Pseudomonas phage phiK7A1]
MSYYATERLKTILDRIQELHTEARTISLDYDIPFSLELKTANGYTVDNYFNPSDASTGWNSSSC